MTKLKNSHKDNWVIKNALYGYTRIQVSHPIHQGYPTTINIPQKWFARAWLSYRVNRVKTNKGGPSVDPCGAPFSIGMRWKFRQSNSNSSHTGWSRINYKSGIKILKPITKCKMNG